MFPNISSCPAFIPSKEHPGTCPFNDGELSKMVGACPAFKDKDCPFKSCSSLDDVYVKLKDTLGNKHKKDSEGDIQFSKAIKQIHKLSEERRLEHGACPLFISTCPFKTLTSNGVPLLEELEWRTWATGITETMLIQSPKPGGPSNLADGLKSGTKHAHAEAENTEFVKAFLKGNVLKEHYVLFTEMLFLIYGCMETQLRKACKDDTKNPLIRSLHFPDLLEREQSLAEDLDYFHGDASWRESVRRMNSPAVEKYMNRLKWVGENEPDLLVAHSYTRYLGDLSGGQILKKASQRHYNLPKSGDGSRFYEFQSVKNLRNFKNEYREILDSLKVDTEMADRLIAEANVAFRLNTAMFNELDVICGFATKQGQMMKKMISSAKVFLQSFSSSGDAKCPFAGAKVGTKKAGEGDKKTTIGDIMGYDLMIFTIVFVVVAWLVGLYMRGN